MQGKVPVQILATELNRGSAFNSHLEIPFNDNALTTMQPNKIWRAAVAPSELMGMIVAS